MTTPRPRRRWWRAGRRPRPRGVAGGRRGPGREEREPSAACAVSPGAAGGESGRSCRSRLNRPWPVVNVRPAPLSSYDLTCCAWSAAQQAGCDPETVQRCVDLREAGDNPCNPSGGSGSRLLPGTGEGVVERSKDEVRPTWDMAARVRGIRDDERTTYRTVGAVMVVTGTGRWLAYPPRLPDPGGGSKSARAAVAAQRTRRPTPTDVPARPARDAVRLLGSCCLRPRIECPPGGSGPPGTTWLRVLERELDHWPGWPPPRRGWALVGWWHRGRGNCLVYGLGRRAM